MTGPNAVELTVEQAWFVADEIGAGTFPWVLAITPPYRDAGERRLFERAHVNDNYLTREMGFQVARKHAAKLARISLLLGGIAPVLIFLALAMVGGSGGFAVLAALVAIILHATGMLVERWLFFAEARHAVMNYYGG